MAKSKFRSEKEGYKICSICGNEKPATLEFFKKCKEGLYEVASRCKECDKIYRKQNEEHIKNHLKKYYIKNKEDYLQRYLLNKNHYLSYRNEWRKLNIKRVKELQKANRVKNYDAIKIQYTNWRAKQLKYCRKDILTTEDWIYSKMYFNNRCAYCNSDDNITIDHIIPFSKKGRNIRGNIVPSCMNCNVSKSNKDYSLWYKEQKFYSEDNYNRIIKYISEA